MIMPRLGRLLGSALVAAAAGVSDARAQATPPPPSLFLSDSTFDTNLTRVFTVDPGSGAMTLRGDLGTEWTPVLGLAAADKRTLYMTGTDTTATALCGDKRACVLLEVTLDPASSTPTSIQPIGPVTAAGVVVVDIVGLTLDPHGMLWASSQADNGLYVINPADASASRVGTLGVTIVGGDLTFDSHDRLWLWTNAGAASGRYLVDPVTAATTPQEIHDGLDYSGLAALAHGQTLYGTSPSLDRLDVLDADTGYTGTSYPLTLDGLPFDHSRGDLDSPYCEDDTSCDDANACTIDSCAAGGCDHDPVPFVDTDRDGTQDCADLCPSTTPGQRVDAHGCSLSQRCPCEGLPGHPWRNHGEYVSCVASVASQLDPGHAGKIVSAAAKSSCGKEKKQKSKKGNGHH